MNDSKRNAWHPAACSAIELELHQWRNELSYKTEHQLNREPLRIDIIVVKKNSELQINNDIARIFKRYNVIEFKSPKDNLSIDDFYKVNAYGCLSASSR